MSLRVYTGLPASGKTSAIIAALEQRKSEGGNVFLILSNEHEELTRRKNVRPGGLMGCRDPSKKFPIDLVIDTQQAEEMLGQTEPGTLIVFDEAQYFKPQIVAHWATASERGLDIIVGTPSLAQLEALETVQHDHIQMSVPCGCGEGNATQVIYRDDLVYPTHLCNKCYEEHMNTEVGQLLEIVKEAEPFPGELHTYQPFFDIDMAGWGLVRTDCPARLSIVLDAVNRCEAVQTKLADAVQQPAFIDLGCCSGFFAHGMSAQGFISDGVDVSKDFIDWATQVAHIKGQAVNYTRQNVRTFLSESDRHYDVISTFATIQWVMAQEGYEAGVECFKNIFEKADSICVIEMGYTEEDIYKDKIADRPREIDREWVLNLMESSGVFDTIELHPSGESGIWRDIFVGFKQKPTSAQVFDDLDVKGVEQTSSAQGHWNDNWVGKNMDVGLRAVADYKKITLAGWRPDDSKPSTLTVTVSGEVAHTSEIGSGLFKVSIPVSISSDARFHFEITNTASFTPENDARQLTFVLQELSFA